MLGVNECRSACPVAYGTVKDEYMVSWPSGEGYIPLPGCIPRQSPSHGQSHVQSPWRPSLRPAHSQPYLVCVCVCVHGKGGATQYHRYPSLSLHTSSISSKKRAARLLSSGFLARSKLSGQSVAGQSPGTWVWCGGGGNRWEGRGKREDG
ncbi:hypothetical protein LX36DRAFT_102891 [Colletotrichum falcatum]|nr:hypothetical protein LX36DRAFT_102891 [Colletotrichum falcatum]